MLFGLELVEVVRGEGYIFLFLLQKPEFMPFVGSLLLSEHGVLGSCKGLADSHMFAKNAVVEGPREFRHGSVTDLLASAHTDHVLSPCLEKHLSCELRVAGSYEHELQLGLARLDELGQPLFRHEVRVSISMLEDQEVALAFGLMVRKETFIVLNPMA